MAQPTAEPLLEGLDEILSTVVEGILAHLEQVPGRPVAGSAPTSEDVQQWLAGFDPERPRSAVEAVRHLMAGLGAWNVHSTHPGYLGFFNPTPTAAGVAAELVAAAFNPQLAVRSQATAAVEAENYVLHYVARRLGFGERAGGVFTSGGSEANATALTAALTAASEGYAVDGLRGLERAPVVYASADAHDGWLKIVHAAGLGRSALRRIPMDARQRMDVDALRRSVDADHRSSRLPLMAVSTAGTTVTGAIDPLTDVAGIAAERGMWHHVDAAWAGALCLSNRHRSLLAGVELANSVTVDAHKWLSAPMGAGMILVRDGGRLADAFAVDATFMPPATGAPDPYTSSVQWSRRFSGAKVLLSLATYGRTGHAARIDHDVELADWLRARLAERSWRLLNDTPLPVLCIAPDASGQPHRWDAAAARLVAERVLDLGRCAINSIEVDGTPALRICVVSHRTEQSHLLALVEDLERARTEFACLVPAPDHGGTP